MLFSDDFRPTASVKIFGSQMTKILTPSSDLDIAILNVPVGKGGVIDLLYELEKVIREKGKRIQCRKCSCLGKGGTEEERERVCVTESDGETQRESQREGGERGRKGETEVGRERGTLLSC